MLSLHHPVDLISLNTGFGCWLNDTYFTRKHSSTGQTPFERFLKGVNQVKHAPSDLSLHFLIKARRKVTTDRIIQLNKRFFEAPIQLIKEQVELLYLPERPEEVELIYKGTSHGFLQELDRYVNAKASREVPEREQKESSQQEYLNSNDQAPTGQLTFS